MDIINQLEIPTDSEVIPAIFFIKPTELGELPIIPTSAVNETYMKIETPETMLKYFQNMLRYVYEFESEVEMINGITIQRETPTYECNYCKTTIKEDWFYCNHCYQDMCKLCKEETSEEIALKNGAKNYKSRENELKKCRESHLIVPRNMYDIPNGDPYNCDLCKNGLKSRFYTKKISDYNTYDICNSCFESDPTAKEEVESKSLKYIDRNNINLTSFGYTDFNSMFYWFPIITDKEYCGVFMNLNVHDKNYRKICLRSCDDHGRLGYFIIYDEKYNLENVLERLKAICDKGEYEDDDIEWETVNGKRTCKMVRKMKKLCTGYYSSPIHVLMQELNMQVYYG